MPNVIDHIQVGDLSYTILDPNALHAGDDAGFYVSTQASDTPLGVTWIKNPGTAQEQTITGTMEATASLKGRVYLVPNNTSGKNVYDEYTVIPSSSGSTYTWELISSASIDLSNYVQKGDAVKGVSGKGYLETTLSTEFLATKSTTITVSGSSFSFSGTSATHNHSVSGLTWTTGSKTVEITGDFVTGITTSAASTGSAVTGISTITLNGTIGGTFNYKTANALTKITPTTGTVVTDVTSTTGTALTSASVKTTATAVASISKSTGTFMSGATVNGTTLQFATATAVTAVSAGSTIAAVTGITTSGDTFVKSVSQTTGTAVTTITSSSSSFILESEFAPSTAISTGKTAYVVVNKPTVTWTASTGSFVTSAIGSASAQTATATYSATISGIVTGGITFSIANATITPAGSIGGSWSGSHTHGLATHYHAAGSYSAGEHSFRLT